MMMTSSPTAASPISVMSIRVYSIDGSPTMRMRRPSSDQTLLKELESLVRNTSRTPNSAGNAPNFQITTMPSDKQKRAHELIGQIKM